MTTEVVKRAFMGSNSKNFRYGITVEDEFYSKEDIEKMDITQCKMLMAMCESMKDIKRVLSWKREDDVFGILESYVNNLEISMNYKPYKAR